MKKQQTRRKRPSQKPRHPQKSRHPQKPPHATELTARSVAVSLVHQVRFGQDAVQAALDTAYGRLKLAERERPLCTELVYGTLRNFDRLEFFLRRFLDRFDSLPKEMGIALCVALYELFYTRVPAYATVDTFVDLIGRQFGQVMGKVANGVLRNADRSRADFQNEQWYRQQCGGSLAALACWYSVPQWLVQIWQEAYGPDQAQLYLEASSKAAPNTLRFNCPLSRRMPAALQSRLTPKSHMPKGDMAKDNMKQSDKARGDEVQPGLCLGEMDVHDELQDPRSDAVARAAFVSLFPFSREGSGEGAHEKADEDCRERSKEDQLAADTVSALSIIEQETAAEKLSKMSGEALSLRARAVWESFFSASSSSSSSFCPPMLTFDGPLPEEAYDFMKKGIVSQQSGAVLEVLSAMKPREWQGPVWDCCCGRGGKTLALLEQGVPVVFASDISRARLRGLEGELDRLGMADACHVERFSATEPLTQSQFYTATGIEQFGTILVDAPCSGFGTLARHPEIRFRRTREDVRKLAALQRGILDNACRWLVDGGRLVYITCTLMPDENEEQIARFLKEQKSMRLCHTFQTPAHSAHGEFFYGACLVKQ